MTETIALVLAIIVCGDSLCIAWLQRQLAAARLELARRATPAPPKGPGQ